MADIFDKMFDSINKGVNSVATSSKTMIEKAKINSAIGTLESEKRAIISRLGAQAYNLYKEDKLQNIEELGGFCRQIDQKSDDILAKQEEIKRLDEAAANASAAGNTEGVFCPNCGSRNNIASKFCSRCGSKLY